MLFAIIQFAMERFDFQGLINDLVQGIGALGLNFDSNATNFSDLGNLTTKVAGKSPFTSIIFRELRGAFISMGMADITIDGLFQYFIELCHMNFFPLEQIFNILWTITKLVLKVYVGGVFCTVVKRLINGIIMAILKHFLNQAMGIVFSQVGILDLGGSTVTDLSGFTSEKIAGRMTAA